MEDRVRLTFHTERPFTGRIFVKGMVENDKCVNNYVSNTKQAIDFHLINGQCNMRRSRKDSSPGSSVLLKEYCFAKLLEQEVGRVEEKEELN
uniref:ZP domain-containing protein n=1 Tax=Ditylenchus dipsaci TaxID=166011 RepID=A0A915ECH1_9BILA